MNPAFQSIYDKLEHQREAITRRVSVLTAEQFMHAPAPGKWSVAQILTHILTAERLMVIYMKKKSLGVNELKNSGILQSILTIVLVVSQRIPAIKFKAPKTIVASTPEALPLSELSGNWNKVRTDLKQFLESIEDKNVRKLIFKHPYAGRLDASQAMRFMYEHTNHHLPQIKKLIGH